jgi:hypothetical protein
LFRTVPACSLLMFYTCPSSLLRTCACCSHSCSCPRTSTAASSRRSCCSDSTTPS